MKALIVGHSAYDMISSVEKFPEENTKNILKEIIGCSGGAACNMAYLLGKYGVETYVGSVVGDDTYGNLIKKELESVKVHTEYMETAYDKRTHFALIITSKEKSTRTIFKTNKDDLFMKKNDFAVDPDVVLVDSYDYGASLSTLNKYTSKKTILNADVYNENTLQLCKYASYIIASQDFAEKLANQKINFNNIQDIISVYSALINKYPNKVVIITIGARGAVYMINNQIKVMPGLQLEVKDTTGAGDIFQSAFAYGLMNNYDLEKCITFANIASGLSVSKEGSSISAPELSEVMNYFKQKYPDAAPASTNTAPANPTPATSTAAPVTPANTSVDSL